MGKQNRLLKVHERQELILGLLRSGEFLSVSEIQERLKARHNLSYQRKVIDRDIKEMSIKYALTEDGGYPRRFGVAFTSEGSKVPVKISEEHLQIISLGLTNLQTVKSLKGSSFSALKALAESLAPELKRLLDSQGESWVLRSPNGGVRNERSSEIMESLLRSLRLGCAIEVKYGSRSAETRRLHPVRMEVSGNALFLLARDPGVADGPIKRFAPNRFHSVVLLTKEKISPASLSELKPFVSTFGGFGGPSQKPERIRIVVGRSVGEHLQEIEYHASQKVKAAGEDRFVVTFDAPVGWPLVRLIAGFGGDVHAIEPKDLREKVTSVWEGGKRTLGKP